jgi:hypothetical protein
VGEVASVVSGCWSGNQAINLSKVFVTFHAMWLIREDNADSDGGLIADRLDQMEGVAGCEDDIAGAGVDITVTFEVPDDFPFGNVPAFIDKVEMSVIGMPRSLADDSKHELLAGNCAFVPGRRAVTGLDCL